MRHKPSCDVFVTEVADSRYKVQCQFPFVTIKLTASDLRFVARVRRFIEATRGDPKLRDTDLGDGRFRRIPTTIVDVSSSFIDSSVVCEKNGEADDSYVVRIVQDPSISLILDLHEDLLDALVDGLIQIAEQYPEETKAAEPGATDNPDDAQRLREDH